jgi:hypothetical protein
MPTIVPDNLAEAIAPVCRKHHVRRLQIFGSTAAGTNRPDSDVDLLVDYEPGFTPTLFSLGRLEQELSSVFDGRPVDLMRPDDLHWFIRRSVLASARTLYEG